MALGIQYRFELYRSGTKVADLTEVDSIQYGYTRNAFKKCSFIHNGNDMVEELKDNLIEGSELRIFRKKYNGTVLEEIYAGEIQNIDRTIDDQGIKTMQIDVEPWGNVFFKSRFISKDYTAQQEEDIAWYLINTTQTDTFDGTLTLDQVNWGIIQGTLEATLNPRDREYEDDEILKSLQQLADVLDVSPNPQRIRGFVLTPDLIDHSHNYFNWYAVLGTTRNVNYTNAVIKTIKQVKSIKDFANKVTANGKDALQETVTTSDTDNLNFYKLRRAYVSKTNIVTSGALSDAAEEELSVRLNPTPVYEIEIVENDPFTGEYRIGDIITIEYTDDEGFLNINEQVRVFEIDISFNSQGIETTKIKVAVERPVSTAVSPTDKLINKVNQSQERLTNLEK